MPEAVRAEFAGVSCPSVTACTAVGYKTKLGTAGGLHKLADGWNGTSWSIQNTLKLNGPTDLNSVSCTSATACMAAGGSTDGPLAEHWNGTRWSVQTLPSPRTAYLVNISSASCTSARGCMATGYFLVAGHWDHTLAYAWNGTRWSLQATPDPGPGDRHEIGTGSDLRSVSCLSATDCTAVGTYLNPEHRSFTLAEHWDGTRWSIQPTPSPAAGGREQAGLLSVSCTSATACTAVGSILNRHTLVGRTLAEVWNGTSWSVQPTPTPLGGMQTDLTGVSCTSATACIAVGDLGNRTFSEHRATAAGGTVRWSVQATPNPGGGIDDQFTGVSCTSATACTAVGSYYGNGGSPPIPLVERYSG